ncbi:MAG: porin [Bacteroidota bacterium]|nr:porin [Bacteroidota bacterium]
MRKLICVISITMLTLSAAFAQEQQVKYNQYGVAVSSDKLDVEAQDGILVLASPESSYKIWFDTRIQADGVAYFGNDDDYDEIGNGAAIRRARFAIKAQLDENWYGEFDSDFANGLVEIKDAIVRYTGFKNLELQAGNFKENFSIQRNTTSRYLQLMERPMVCSALAPSRHIGFNAKYANKAIWASGGIFFQEMAGSEEYTNVTDNNKDYGRGSGYSLTGKLVYRPLYKSQTSSLHLGAAVSYRTALSSVAPSDWGAYRASARNSTNINRKKYVDTDLLRGYNHNLLYTVEVAGHHDGLRYEAAYIGDHVCFNDAEARNFGGWYAQAGYLLFGGSQRYDANGGKYTKVRRGRSWGDVELCARYEFIDLNDGNVYGGSAEAYTLGINWIVNNNVKIMLNYQFNNNDRYANGKGKLLVGHDASGKPTKDYTKVVEAGRKAGVDYHMLGIRFEVDF